MTQETEKEDPRQVPPKRFASERPRSEQSTKTPALAGSEMTSMMLAAPSTISNA